MSNSYPGNVCQKYAVYKQKIILNMAKWNLILEILLQYLTKTSTCFSHNSPSREWRLPHQNWENEEEVRNTPCTPGAVPELQRRSDPHFLIPYLSAFILIWFCWNLTQIIQFFLLMWRMCMPSCSLKFIPLVIPQKNSCTCYVEEYIYEDELMNLSNFCLDSAVWLHTKSQ